MIGFFGSEIDNRFGSSSEILAIGSEILVRQTRTKSAPPLVRRGIGAWLLKKEKGGASVLQEIL